MSAVTYPPNARSNPPASRAPMTGFFPMSDTGPYGRFRSTDPFYSTLRTSRSFHFFIGG